MIGGAEGICFEPHTDARTTQPATPRDGTIQANLAANILDLILASTGDIVVVTDKQGTIVTWNAAAERITGLDAGRVRGRPLASLLAREQQSGMADRLRRLISGGGAFHRVEGTLVTATGDEVPVAWNVAALRESGETLGIVAVGQDLTAQRGPEAQLVESLNAAVLGTLVGGIAHELRNPLGVIAANAQLLEEHPGDAEVAAGCVPRIQRASRRASAIIENLLRLARAPEEGMSALDINAVLVESLDLVADRLASRAIAFRMELQPALPPVRGNEVLLQQVFTNLILNACNAMPWGGTLTVATRECQRGAVEVEFRDTGRGIDSRHLSRIFDPFFTTMPVGQGTGLGLPVSSLIVGQHGGSIDVESREGAGTRLTVRLPCAGGDAV